MCLALVEPGFLDQLFSMAIPAAAECTFTQLNGGGAQC